MKEKIAKQVIYWLSVIIVGIALGLGLQFVRAWTEPGANPPGGNVGAPLNTSANTQVKVGSLGINSNGNPVGLMVNGNVGIGTTAPDVKLDVVGGTAQADDFCLNSNSSKCLSTMSITGAPDLTQCTIRQTNNYTPIACGLTSKIYCNDDEVAVSGGMWSGSNAALQNTGPIMSGSKPVGWIISVYNVCGGGENCHCSFSGYAQALCCKLK